MEKTLNNSGYTDDIIVKQIIGDEPVQSIEEPTEIIDTKQGMDFENSQNTEEVDLEFLEDFILEAKDHLENIDSQVIELEKNPDDEEIIHSMFRAFHTIKGLAGFVNQTAIQHIAHQTETLMDACRKGKISVDKVLVDLILGSSDLIKQICGDISLVNQRVFQTEITLHMEKLENFEMTSLEKSSSKKIGEILVEQHLIAPQEVEEVLEKQKNDYPELKFGEIAVKEEKVKPVEVINALKLQQNKQSEEYMRISTGKVDNLVDMVGELIITQALIEQHASNNYGGDSFFIANLGRMERITKDLQNISLFLRMVALKSTFQKISRIARDTIKELGKDINFSTIGDDTEIDRVVTEKLLDPLVHLVKNSISHGIESPEERIAAGKSAQGNVVINAYNKRGNIYIEIIDDGAGINTERVYQKALEKGLVDASKEYTEKEIQEFIMLPGFSTLDVANNISGRGVGMDVVKTEISKIGGKIEIFSEKGKGSKFILKIPVNHAVMNGTIVDVEGSNYIIPTLNVKQILQPKEEQWVTVQGVPSMIKVREDIIPLMPVSKLFRTGKADEEIKLVVIIELDQKFKALPVKNVIGRQEVVIKPVGEEFSGLKYVSGMSILGDGKVSLILDVEHLFATDGAS
jgi:two-component system chemotaxis sensor kinase CheA